VNTRVRRLAHGPSVLIRPLANGDVDTVLAVLHRLGDDRRRRPFYGVTLRLSEDELWQLSRVDANHHALVGYVEGDRRPAALARLVRDGRSAEVALDVAMEYRGLGVDLALADELLADARAAGITEITSRATQHDAAGAFVWRARERLGISFDGGDRPLTAFG
jgi:ribosomal protein S18 acetylase RimI-like enzyme